MSPNDWQIAQLNTARPVAPLTSPRLAGFVARLDDINALADNSPGFAWRHIDAADEAEATPAFASDLIVNLSVWESIEQLHDYVYRTAHSRIMARRREWFSRTVAASSVLWWVPAGHRPGLQEAARRLALLEERGPGPEAFTFKQSFPVPQGDAAMAAQHLQHGRV